MATESNLYIEKVISEHPIAAWVLSEQVDYIQLLSETNRQVYTPGQWTVTGATATSELAPIASPFASSATTKLDGSNSVSFIFANSTFSMPANNPYTVNYAISGYLYIGSTYGTSYSYGYQYDDGVSGLTYYVEEVNPIYTTDLNKWVFFSNTFDCAPVAATNIKMFIKINVTSGGTPGNYLFYVNGLSAGNLAEDFNYYSLGISSSSVTSLDPFIASIPAGIKGTQALAYGSYDKTAYYTCNLPSGGSLGEVYARNFGIPLVFGSSNVTKLYDSLIYPSTDIPCLLFPGYGFLNEKGKYNEYTVEMWISINPDVDSPKRIFGPVSSNDGLYVEHGFLTLLIGKNYQSYYVGEWDRPMLLDIKYSDTNASVMLNGEEVIAISYLESDLTFPTEYTDSTRTVSNDWLAFYADALINPFTIDSFAIYSYLVPTDVAKRRFVWGQGVKAPELQNSSLNTTTAFIDHSFSNLAVSYHYPDFANWRQGFFSNLVTNSNTLELPEYLLPTFNLGSKTLQNWYDDLYSIPADYFTFRPTGGIGWGAQTCYIDFGKVSILNESVDSIYGVFTTDGSASNEPLFKLTNQITNDYFLVKISGTSLTYTINISGTSTVLATKTITVNQKFVAGINFTALSLQGINGINNFFTNQGNLYLLVGGDKTTTFTGKMYTFGFDTGYNNRKNLSLYDSTGIFKINDTSVITGATSNSNHITYTSNHNFIVGDVISITSIVSTHDSPTPANSFNLTSVPITAITDTTFTVSSAISGTYVSGGTATITQNNRGTTWLNHNPNYGLIPMTKYAMFFADISCAGYWEDYVPLSYFAKYIKDYKDDSQYDLDSMQINIDYPEPVETQLKQINSTWTYQDLYNEFHTPVPFSYEDLANNLFTSWDNYLDLKNHAIKYYYYDTSASTVRTYVSFQKIINGSNRNLVDFNSYDLPRAKGVLDADAVSDWENTAFEVVDGTVILPPSQYNDNSLVNFNDIGIVSHVEFNVNGIINSKTKLRDLQLSSQVYERTSFTELGTKYGIPIYPFYKTGLYYNFKGENPIEMYKDSTPHLFLTRHSGWRMRGSFNSYTDRGLLMSINKEKTQDFELSSVQVWLKFADKKFPQQEVKIMSIAHKDGSSYLYLDLYLVADSSTQRGKIYAKNRETDAILNNVSFYINGNLVDTPFIINKEWYCLGIAFDSLLKFDSYEGALMLNGPMTYNNISYTTATNLEKEQSVEYRSWSAVNAGGNWQFWKNSYTWNGTEIISSNDIYNIDPSDIYARYVGTNRIVIDDNDNGILVDPDKFKVYGDIGWFNTVKTPV